VGGQSSGLQTLVCSWEAWGLQDCRRHTGLDTSGSCYGPPPWDMGVQGLQKDYVYKCTLGRCSEV
jgi:hypothetical protein